MNSISLDNIQIYGDLAMRTLLNYSRLESVWYRPEKVFEADQANWPGDWKGRAKRTYSFIFPLGYLKIV
ncbi:hypothetical protein [Lachnoclostridium sp.]|uniref:hypothetical protein n=1 Tax=Lachnoclostridium sp. TaxID=2028282 RepID=UPI00289B24E3|nr:hypothetical protein [Lachnoclostridium sp.]